MEVVQRGQQPANSVNQNVRLDCNTQHTPTDMSLTRAVASGSARSALRALPAASSSSARTLSTSARRLEEKQPKREKRKSNRIYDKGTFNFNTSLNFVADRDPDVSASSQQPARRRRIILELSELTSVRQLQDCHGGRGRALPRAADASQDARAGLYR